MTTWNNINKKLKKARVNSGFTQAQTAAYLNCSQSYVCRKEQGKSRIYAWELLELAKLYNVDITYFSRQ